MTEYRKGRAFVTKDDRLIFKRKEMQKWKRYPPVSAVEALDVMPETVITITYERGSDRARFSSAR